MATITWTGAAADGNYNNPANWNPAQVPTAADTVTISTTTLTAISVANNAALNLTTNNHVTLNLADNTSFTFGSAGSAASTFSNAGTFALNSTNDATVLAVAAPTLSLTGSGTVLLGNNGSNYIEAGAAGDELNNVNNLIEGAGQIGAGDGLVFVNGTAGILNANQSAGLYLSTGGSGTTLNSGLFEATGSGALFIESVVNDGTLGKISAAGANVYLQGGDIKGGTISTSGGADLVVNASATIDGGTTTVTNTGTVVVNDNIQLNLLGTISNKGTISLGSTNDYTALVIGSNAGSIASTVTLTGSGHVVLGDNASNYITDGIAGDTLVNLNNTISGAGTLSGTLSVINDATIQANAVNNALVINTAGAFTNSGTLAATVATDGGLVINSVINNGTLGIVQAATGNVYLQSGSLQGGTIKTSGGGEVVETATGTLDGTAHALTNLGTVSVEDNRTLTLLGAIANNGTIALGSTNDATTLEISSAIVTLTGSGTLALNNNGSNYIFATPSSGDELDNVSNTIQGAGQIGGAAALTLVNGAAGVIDSNLSAGLTLNVGSVAVANAGLIEATGTGGLTIYNTTITNTGSGTILASTANVDLNSGTIVGGAVNSSGGGEVLAVGGTNLLQAVTIKGTVAVADNRSLGLSGTITNDGSINLLSQNDGTVLEVVSPTVTLTGAGTVVLTDDGSNYIYGAVAADVLDNVNNTIEGGGLLGDGQLTLVNGPAGTISATGTNSVLEINTGSISVTNSGLIEATGPAGLQIYNSTITNGTLGVISGAQGIVYLDSATIQGGTLTDSGGGSIVDQSNSTLNGTVNTVTNDATLTVNDNNNLFLLGTITNAGTIALASTNDATSLYIGPSGATGTVTLTGGGQVVLSNDSQNYIQGYDGSGTTLINLNNTISGGGTLGYNGMYVTNDSVVNANQASQLTIDGGTTFTNNDLIESTGTGGLFIYNTTISNGTAGTIAASGGAVTIQSADILGGLLTGTGGIYTGGSSTLDGTANAIVNKASVTLYDNNNLYVMGTIDNIGTITLASTNDATSLYVGPSGVAGTVTLTGNGQIVLSNDGSNYIQGNDGSGSTLINLNNTISGGGTLGYNGMYITNDSVVNADDASQLTIDGGTTFTNNDLIESTGTGGLFIYDTTISNGTAGTIAASGGIVTIQSADILGGTLTGSGGFYTGGSSTLDGTANAIVNKASLTLYDNNNLYVSGTIDNIGTITLASANDATALYIGPMGVAGTVTFTGGGQLVLSNDGSNYILGNDGSGSTLINLNNTISGGGTLGTNGLYITNDSVVNADDSSQLTIDGGTTFTNNGLIESTGTGGLFIYDTTISNGAAGTIAASAGNITVQSATIEGGLISGNTSTTIYMSGGSVLGAATGTLTNTGSIVLQDNSNGYLEGAIDNNGSISVDSGNDTTQLMLGTPTVTLTGTGAIVLNNNGADYLDGAGGDVLDNVSNTIEGGGNFGNGNINLINGGIVEANDPTTLTMDLSSTGTNLAGGQFLAANGATLLVNTGTFTNAGLIQADDASFVTFGSSAILTNNANNGTLTGGSYGAVSTGDGATLSITGSAVSTIAASIILSGAASTIAFGGTTIDASLQTIAAGGTLSLLNGRAFSATANSGTLADNGLLSLGGTSFTAASLAIGTTGTLSGYGTVAGPVTDAGTIDATGGTLTFTSAVSGAGTLAAASGAVVDLTVPGTLTEAISGAGTLQLDGGTYTLAGKTVAIGTVKIDAGSALTGNGTVTGTVIDSGSVNAAGGTLVIDGAVNSGSFSAAAGATLDLAGGGSFAGLVSGAGTLEISSHAFTLTSGASLTVANVLETANLTLASDAFTNGASAHFTIDAATGQTVVLGATGTSSFSNAGTFLANGPGTADITTSFANTGTASVTAGTLLLAGALSGGGTLSAGTGAVLDIGGGGSFAGALTGAGTLDIGAHGLTLSTGASLSASTVVQTGNLNLASVAITNGASDSYTITATSGQTLLINKSGTGSNFTNAGKLVANGAGIAEIVSTFTDTGTASVTAGTLLLANTLAGSGTLSAGAGALFDISAGGSFSGALTGAGTIAIASRALTLTAGASLSAAYVLETANLTLAGAPITNAAGDTYTITAAAGQSVVLGSTGTGSLTNAGTLVANGAGTADITTVFTDNGTASASAGTLLLANTLAGSGTLSAGAGALIDINDGGSFAGALTGAGTIAIGTHGLIFAAGASLSAANVIQTGSINLVNDSITNAAGDSYTITAASGQTVLINRSGTGTFTNAGTLVANGAGIAEISATFADTGTASVTAGTLLLVNTLSGSGTLSAGAGALLDVTGGGTFSGALTGAGTLDIATHGVTLGAGASLSAATLNQSVSIVLASDAITNGAGDTYTITAASGPTDAITGSGSGSSFTNAGTFTAGGTGTDTVGVAFINTGTVNASAGTVTLLGAFTDNGIASVTTGTLLLDGTLSGSGTLSAGTGAVLNIKDGGSFAGALTGAGTLDIASGLTLSAGASLSAAHVVQTVSILVASDAITNAAGDSYTITAASGQTVLINKSGTGSNFTNAGVLVANGAGTAEIVTTFADTGTASVTAGTLLLANTLSGSGTLSAGAGTTLNISGGGSFSGALSGAGTLDIGTHGLSFTAGASLSAANVVQTGGFTLFSDAVTNAAGDAYTMATTAGASLVLAGTGTGTDFTNAGTFSASGTGTATANLAFINSGTVNANAGTLSFLGAVTNNGTIDAASGLTSINTTVSGTGTLEVGSTGTLSLLLGAGSGQVVDFAASAGLLDLTKPLDFTGTITGFGGSDQIDLLNTAETSYTYANNVLTVKNGTSTVASLNFTGSSNSFTLGSDGHSGTLIKFG